MAGNEVRIRAWVDDKVSGALTKIQDRFDTLGKSKGFQSIVSGVGLGIGVSLWQQASGQIVNVLGDAMNAALEDEASIKRLGTSLQANVKDWDGNTDAIERQLKARMALGFSDDEQRDSLAKIVVATHDVNKALEVQRTAMDLARLKGISLAAAGDALIKVEGGQFRALKALGIQLKDGATATDALAAVQRAAAGQAEAFADTTQGKLLVAQTQVGEAMETFGYATLPAVATGLEAVAGFAIDVATALDGLQHVTELTNEQQADLGQSLLDIASALPGIGGAFGVVSDKLHDARDNTADAAEDFGGFAGKIEDDFVRPTTKGFDAVADSADDMRKDVHKSVAKMQEDMSDAAQDMIDEFFDPIEIRSDVLAAHTATLEATKRREHAKTKREVRDASDDIADSLDDQVTALNKLASKGKLTGRDIDNFEKDARAAYRSMGQKIPPQLQKVIDKLRGISSYNGDRVSMEVIAKLGFRNLGNLGNSGARAMGGPIDPDKVYMVGEQGPELFVSRDAGQIIPNGALRRGRSGPSGGGGFGGGDVTVVLSPPASWTPAMAREWANGAGPAIAQYLRDRRLI